MWKDEDDDAMDIPSPKRSPSSQRPVSSQLSSKSFSRGPDSPTSSSRSLWRSRSMLPDRSKTSLPLLTGSHIPASGFSLRQALLTRYGSTINAWRTLDPRGHGKISHSHFNRAVHHLGGSGSYDMKKLWTDLDVDEDGFITLEDIDPALAELLKAFANVISKAHGSAAEAWERVFSWGQHGRCSLERFTRVACQLGYGTSKLNNERSSSKAVAACRPHDASAVFEALNPDHCGVSFKEFELLDRWFKPIQSGGWHYGTLRSSCSMPNLGTITLRPSSSAASLSRAMAAAGS